MRQIYYPDNVLYYSFAYDPEGSVVTRQNSTNTYGNAMSIAVHDAYGNLLMDQRPSDRTWNVHKDRVNYQGQWGAYSDWDVNLSGTTREYSTLMTHRYYDPRTGRFINRDPIGYNGGINQYAYAGGNPIMGSDISGLIANITMSKNNVVSIEIPINFQKQYNDAGTIRATDTDIQEAIKGIETKWTGTFGIYKVTTKVKVTTGVFDDKKVNVVLITPQPGISFCDLEDPNADNGGLWHLYYDDGGRTQEEISKSRKKWPNVAAHESGHLMGLWDKYVNDYSSGFRNTYPLKVYNHKTGKLLEDWTGNIMGESKGRVEERNIKMILEGHGLIK